MKSFIHCLLGFALGTSCTSADKNEPVQKKDIKKKNIIYINADQLRWDALGYMGNKVVKTPNIDRMAENGTVFTEVYCASPICGPSRVATFSGLYPHHSGSLTNHDEDFIQTDDYCFLTSLKENGFVLGQAGKNHSFSDEYFNKNFSFREQYGHWGKEYGHFTPQDSAVKKFMSKDPRDGEKFRNVDFMLEGLINESAPFKPEEWMTYRLTSDAIDFIDQNRDDQFFLHMAFPGPHFPQMIPEPYYSMYKTGDIPDLEAKDIDWTDQRPFKHFVQSMANDFDKYTDAERKKILAIYYGQISFIDDQIGRLVNYLEDNGLKENTIIIFTADHGDFAGRYNLIGKTGGFHEPLVRIPLIIDFNENDFLSNCNANISNIDLFPTILDYLGIKYPENIDGISFLPSLTNPNNKHRDVIFSEVGSGEKSPPPVSYESYPEYAKKRAKKDGGFWFIEYTVRGKSVMVKKDHWKYVYYRDDINEMYNTEADPLELNNLAGNEKYRQKENEMKDLILNWLLE